MKSFILSVWLIFAFDSFAQIPFGHDLRQNIEETFFHSDGVDFLKLENYRAQIRQRQQEIINIVSAYHRNRKGRDEEKALEKAKEKDYIKHLDLVLELVDRLENESDTTKRYQLADKILDIDYATKSEITPYNWNRRLYLSAKQFLGYYEISKRENSVYGEASNLVHPESGEFLTPEELNEFDISKLNPPKDNGVIELINNISQVDVRKRYLEGQNKMHQGLYISWPAEPIGKLEKIKKTQSRPKIIFSALDQHGKKREWKLKLLQEIHSDPTAAALGSTLGFFTDITKHVGRYKIYLGKMTYDEFFVDFSSYYEPDFLERVLESKGEDERGEFIVFKEGMLEIRFEDEDLNRIGPYYPTRKKGLRETRAWQLYNIWINNIDLKPGENNKLTLRREGDDIKLFGFQHDLGFAFGDWEREKPYNFKWNAVRKITRKKIQFQFSVPVLNEGWDHVTYADGKWITRKIAQMTRKQISDAVDLGQWPNEAPYNYRDLLIEKLIARRNDLVRAFELEGEMLPSGKRIELMKVNREVSKNALATNVFLDGHTVDFREEKRLMFVTEPLEMLNDLVVSSAQSIIGGVNRISLSPVWYGIDEFGLVAQVLTNFSRQVVVNPNPTGEHDQYIARDNFALGVRGGKGIGVGLEAIGDVGYVREYSLIYPVSSPDEANRRSKFIVDFKMPYRVFKQGLPKKHILITQNYIEGRGRLRAEVPVIGPGAQETASRIYLDRTILSHDEDGSLTLYDDRSISTARSSEVYLRLVVARLNQLEDRTESGRMERFITKLENHGVDPDMERAIDDAVLNHDFEALRALEPEKKVVSDFIERERGAGFFGFLSWKSRFRVDELKIYHFNDEGELVEQNGQVDALHYTEQKWSWIKDGETKYKRLRWTSDYNTITKQLENPRLVINIGMNDLTTWQGELEDQYLTFFNGVVGDPNFFKFTPEIHAYNKSWGHIEFILTQVYHKEALEKIMNLSKEQVKYSLADAFKIPRSKMDRQWAWVTASAVKRKRMSMPERLSLRFFGHSYDMDRIIRRANFFYKKLEKARRRVNLTGKLDTLVYAFEKLAPSDNGFYSPVMLYVLNKLVGEENFLTTAQMVIPTERDLENKLPARMKPYFQRGTVRDLEERERIIMSTKDALDLYHSVFSIAN